MAVSHNPLVEKHRAFLTRQQKMLIGDSWVDAAAGETLAVLDPSTGQEITRIALADETDIDRAVEAARQAFRDPAWADMKPTARQKLLLQLADLIERHADELAELESIDNGKVAAAARMADLNGTIEFVRYMAGWATKISGETLDVSVPRLPDGKFFAYTKPRPVGVVAAIVPWNFPLMMAIWKVAPALATGCTVVLKPAEQTSLTALRLGELVREAGYPAGVLNVVTGLGAQAGAALVEHPAVDKVTFTGSVETGKLIGKSAVESMKRFTLELGGKSPMIVMPDMPVEQAVQGAANAIFYNQGQVCTAGSRLYIHRSIFDEVTRGIADHAAQLTVGPGHDSATRIGPLVSEEQAQRVCRYVEIGRSEGARVLTGGERLDRPGYYVSPAVMVDVDNRKRVVCEEIFGPVLTAMPFDTEEEVIALANDSRYGLAGSVWTRDLAVAHRMAERVEAGIFWINCHNVLDPNLPFGGVKASGIGRELGKASIDAYLETKSVMMRLA